MTDADESAPVDPPRRHRRGPKPKDPSALRRHSVTARLTDAEVADLDACRGTAQRSEYMRRAALTCHPPQVPEVNRERWVELSRVGSNLNQVAYRANMQGSADVDEVRDLLERLRCALIGADPSGGNTEDAAGDDGTDDGDGEAAL